MSSLVLNLTIAYRRAGDIDGLTRCLLTAAELSRAQTDPEAWFRILVAVGTVVAGGGGGAGGGAGGEMKELAASLDLGNFLRICKAEQGVEKVRECSEALSALLK